MADYSPVLHLPLVAPNQNQKETTINTALAILEAASNDTLAYTLSAGTNVLNDDEFTKYFLLQFDGPTGLSPLVNVEVPATPRYFAVENQSPSLLRLKVTGSIGGATVDLPSGKIGLLVSDANDLRYVVPDPVSGLGLLNDLSDVDGVPTNGQFLRYVAAENNWKPYTLSIVWDDIADAPDYQSTGNNGRLLAVKNDGSGLEWVTSAANINSFVDLDDTPNSYSGQANRTLVVNSTATGVTFATPSIRGNSDFPGSFSGAAGKFLKVNLAQTAVEFGMPKVADLTDGPGQSTFADALWYVRVNAAGTGLEYAPGSGGPVNFTELLDTPNSFSGQGLKLVRVGVDEDQLIFDDFGFLELNDTPVTYSGQAAKFVAVKSNQTGVEFRSPTVQDLTNGPGAFAGNAKRVVRVNANNTALEYAALALTDLAGFPTSFGGQGGKYLQVRPDEMGVQFVASAFTTNFLALTDTPTSYAGKSGQMVIVNPAASGLIFAPVPAVPTHLGDLVDVENGTGIPAQGSVLTWYDGVWQAEPSIAGATNLEGLTDVHFDTAPVAGQALVYRAGQWHAEDIETSDVHNLGDLGDVEMGTTLVDGHVLTWKDGVWQAEPGGTSDVQTLGDLTDVEMGTALVDGHVLTWKDGVWQAEPGGTSDVQGLGDLTDVEMGTALVDGYVLTWKDGVWQPEPGGTSDVQSLGDLTDVEMGTALVDGQVLTWKDGIWQAEVFAGSTLNTLADVDVEPMPVSGQALVWNDGKEMWEPGARFEPGYWQNWRIKINAGATSAISIAQLTFFDDESGDNLVELRGAGGAPLAGNTAVGSAAANAFDNDGATSWKSNTVNGSTFLGYWFPDPVRVRAIELQHDIDEATLLGPIDFEIQYSDGEVPYRTAWRVRSTQVGIWNPGDTKTFVMPDEGRVVLSQIFDVEYQNGYPSPGDLLQWDGNRWVTAQPSFPDEFIELIDSPGGYYDSGGMIPSVNEGASGLEWRLNVADVSTPTDYGKHAYWRIAVKSLTSWPDNDAVRFALSELQFRSVPGGPNQAAGGTAFSTTPYTAGPLGTTSAAHAFDGDAETSFVSAVTFDVGDEDVHLGYHFAAPVAVQEVWMQSQTTIPDIVTTGYNPPYWFIVQYSDDGSTYTDAWEVDGTVGDWRSDDVRRFTAPAVPGVSFRSLLDAPHSYIDQAGKSVRVKATEDGVEFYTPPSIPVTLGDLADVEASTAASENQVLTWKDGVWQAESLPASSLGALADVTITAPSASQVLAYRDGEWVNEDPAATGVPSFGSHVYWRLLLHTNNGGARFGINEIEFRTTKSGAVLSTGGTPLSSSFFTGQPPSGAFDGSLSGGRWDSSTNTDGEWIGYQFTGPVEVRYVTVAGAQSDPTYSPKDFDIQWSDDGTTWTTAWSVASQTGWAAAQLRQYHGLMDLHFTDLADAPMTYIGQAGKLMVVNATETALEFLDLSGQANKMLGVNSTGTALAFVDRVADKEFFWGGKPGAGELLTRIHTRTPFRVLSSANHGASSVVGPAASAVFSIRKNGTQFGTCTFSGGSATFSVTQTDFAANDILSIYAPSSQDVNLTDVSITLKATRL